MKRCGLSVDLISDEALNLITKNGYENFSLRVLAASLGVKPASLYNHINGVDQIMTEVAVKSAEKLRQALLKAIKDKPKDEAFIAGTKAYRQFALDNPEIYKALIRMPSYDHELIGKIAYSSCDPLFSLILSYGVKQPDITNFLRALRATMHGFIDLTANGFMQHGPISCEETYENIIHNFLNTLKGLPTK